MLSPASNERSVTESLFTQDPDLVNGLLDAIQSISDEARRVLADPELPREQQLEAIGVRYHYII